MGTLMEEIDVSLKKFNLPPISDVVNNKDKSISYINKLLKQWSFYYGKLSSQNDKLATPLDALISDCEEVAERNITSEQETKGESTVELGDEGERYVYQLEKNRVANFNARLVGKVIALGKTKGLGYDIQSVIAEPGDEAEFVKYIEVKYTKRVTVPDLTLEDFNDTLNITRNELIAAQQHK